MLFCKQLKHDLKSCPTTVLLNEVSWQAISPPVVLEPSPHLAAHGEPGVTFIPNTRFARSRTVATEVTCRTTILESRPKIYRQNLKLGVPFEECWATPSAQKSGKTANRALKDAFDKQKKGEKLIGTTKTNECRHATILTNCERFGETEQYENRKAIRALWGRRKIYEGTT